MSETRTYRKKARAEAEEATGKAILDAALNAFTRDPFDRVTLQQIADNSGVTVQTIIRRFGSKESLFEQLAAREGERIIAEREVPETDSLSTALGALLGHYERDGEMISRFVSQEKLFEPVRKVVATGRRVHREWVERHCRHLLLNLEGRNRERMLMAAISATDLSLWKLLRHDYGLDSESVAAVMELMLDGLNGLKHGET